VNGHAYNVGGSEPISHRDLVRLLIEVAGSGSCRFVPWPPDKKAIDIGSFYADSTRFRTLTGWSSPVQLREGLARSVAFYREHLQKYVDDPAKAPLRLA
jgi:UDP-glucose 4-epimerase